MAILWPLVLISAIGAVAQAPSTAPSNPVVDLGYARYQGIANSTLGIASYYALPYAQPPTGDLRWRRPVPIEQGKLPSTVINATTPGPTCPQYSPPWLLSTILVPAYTALSPSSASAVEAPSSEDCLHLDVTVPLEPKSSLLPVVVYIHGGGYSSGSAAEGVGDVYVPHSNGSIVYVAIQYRLNSLGFLAGDAVGSDGTWNAGLLDQRLALQWIQKHITAFGGDPDRVTIIGGSAGGGSVTSQMMLFGGKDRSPPFRAAIAEFPWWQSLHSDVTLNATYSSLLKATKCDGLACLRSMNISELMNATNTVGTELYEQDLYGTGDYLWGPSVDGKIIQGLPTEEFSHGHFSKVPVIVNHDSFEGAIFTDIAITRSQLKSRLKALWPLSKGDSKFYRGLNRLYPRSAFDNRAYLSTPVFKKYAAFGNQTNSTGIVDPPTFYQYQTIFGDAYVDCATWKIAESIANANQPVYKLRFARDLQVHAAVDYFAASGRPAANRLVEKYLNFATTLNPNKGRSEKPHWPKWNGKHLVLNYNVSRTGVSPDWDVGPRCRFLLSHGNILRT